MRLTPHIDLIGSGGMGFSLTHPLDCHIYLIRDGDDAVIMDAGAGVDIAPILSQIDQSGVPRGAIRRLLLTHGHGDHAGGAKALRDALGVEVWASPPVAGWVGAGDERALSLDRSRGPAATRTAMRSSPARWPASYGMATVSRSGAWRSR